MWTHFILIFFFRQSLTADSAKSFKLISDNEVKSIDFLANAVRDDTLIQYLVERIENIERFAKTEHENNLVLKERVVQLEARDRQRDHQFAEIQERCEHLESKLGQEMISRRSNEIDTPVNQNASSRHGSHSGDDIFHVKQLMASHERNYGKNHSMMKKAKHTRGSDDYRILTPVNEEPVAFFATLGKHMVNTGVNQVIPFENVITNVGNGYNPHAGDFRAPVTGIYIFSVSLLTLHDNTYLKYAFRRNGTVVSSMYLRGETGSQTVVYELNKGDDVAVICRQAVDESLNGYGYSTFAGFLLQKTYPSANIVGRK